MRSYGCALTLILASTLAGANPGDIGPEVEVAYNLWSRHSLERFEVFDEGESFDAKARPALTLLPNGLGGKPGLHNGGNYTAWKFDAVDSDAWELRASFELPASAEYSNSGIFFLMQEPKTTHGAAAIRAKAAADERRKKIGQAPTELEYFGYELQIIAGKANHDIPPQNQGPGAFYGVPLAPDQTHIAPGNQFIHQPYPLEMGNAYELIVRAERSLGRLMLLTYFKNSKLPTKLTHVSTFVVPSAVEDPARGGYATSLYLQAFNNNGATSQIPIFKDLRVLKAN